MTDDKKSKRLAALQSKLINSGMWKADLPALETIRIKLESKHAEPIPKQIPEPPTWGEQHTMRSIPGMRWIEQEDEAPVGRQSCRSEVIELEDTLCQDLRVSAKLDDLDAALELSQATAFSLDDTAQINAEDVELPLDLAETLSAKLSSVELPTIYLSFPNDELPFCDLHVRQLIGEGGTGRVFRVMQTSLYRDVAVKTIRPQAEVDNPGEMLLHEGVLTGHLEHPNIIPIHALGRDPDGNPVLIMKYVEGILWSVLLNDPQHPFWHKLNLWSDDQFIRHIEILLEICKAVQFAHSRKIIHRDIKPNNVMLGEFGQVYLLDWGIAKRVSGELSQPAAVELSLENCDDDIEGIYGTPAYMAPEMLEGEHRLDQRTDIYLLGATLHEILSGLPPNVGDSVEDALLSVLDDKQFVYGEDVPDGLVQICRKAMQNDMSKRYQCVEEFRDALLAHTRHHASSKVSDLAKDRLSLLHKLCHNELINPQLATQIHRVFTECRFGFVQALREWSDNPAARQGLEECLRIMFGWEIAHRNVDAATALLQEMESPPVDFMLRLQQMRDQEVGTDLKQPIIRKLDREDESEDTVVTSSQWLPILTLCAVASVFLLFRVYLGTPADLFSGYLRAVFFAIATTFILLSIIVFGQQSLLQDPISRRFIGIALFGCIAVSFHRIMRAYQQHPLAETFFVDLALLGCMIGVTAIAMHIWLVRIALVLFGGAALCYFSPSYHYHFMNVTVTIAWYLGVYFWFWKREHIHKREYL